MTGVRRREMRGGEGSVFSRRVVRRVRARVAEMEVVGVSGVMATLLGTVSEPGAEGVWPLGMARKGACNVGRRIEDANWLGVDADGPPAGVDDADIVSRRDKVKAAARL